MSSLSDTDDDAYSANGSSGQIPSRSTIAQTHIIHSPTGKAYHLKRDQILEELAEKQFPLQEGENVSRTLKNAEDQSHFAATYLEGGRIHHIVPGAWQPTVAIVLVKGSDIISVNQAEQDGPFRDRQREKTPRWRVLTAGTLLTTLEFDEKLTIRKIDGTPQVVADMLRRSTTSQGRGGSALFRVAREDRVLTIDSDNVKLVDSPSTADIEATLIEVDKSSLANLVLNFHRIIQDGGAVLNTDLDSRVELLEAMIEDARRLAVRSPILFRMSTRQHIAQSKSVRFGFDHSSMFETITTSAGIKTIISRSAGCFDSLATVGDDDRHEQSLIQPKFLQMLVLLLSLLNDQDLQSLAEFLKQRGINPDRTHVELLILKVLPLQSINKSIFIREMVTAVHKRPQECPDTMTEEQIWNAFIADLIKIGYVLPGYTKQMGQLNHSWIVKFPKGEGLKDSHVFNNLQHHDESSKFNLIPSMDLTMNPQSGEVTTILTNGKRYLIRIADHRKIIGIIFGEYSITEATREKRNCDLTISEVFVNDYLNQAIAKTNQLLTIINNYFATVKPRRKLVKSFTARLEDLNIVSSRPRGYQYPDITSCGRLTWHEAQLNGHLLAIAYKVEGRKIARRDLIRNFTDDINKVKTMVHYIKLEMQRQNGRNISDSARQTINRLNEGLPEIVEAVKVAERNKKAIENTNLDIGDEIVATTISPNDSAAKRGVHWSSYQMRLADGGRGLHVAAYCRKIVKFAWVSDDVIELHLTDPTSYRNNAKQLFVSPLEKIKPEMRKWEVRVNDEVLMIGQYLAIIQKKVDEQIELPAQAVCEHPHEQPAYTAFSANYRGYPRGSIPVGPNSRGSVSRVPVPSARPIHKIQNWVRITMVPNDETDPRLYNQQNDDMLSDFVIH